MSRKICTSLAHRNSVSLDSGRYWDKGISDAINDDIIGHCRGRCHR
jgi:hypothetical protein